MKRCKVDWSRVDQASGLAPELDRLESWERKRKTVTEALAENESLKKLMWIQNHLEESIRAFDEVLQIHGAPRDTREMQEEFCGLIANCEECLKRLVGSVVYHVVFDGLDDDDLREPD